MATDDLSDFERELLMKEHLSICERGDVPRDVRARLWRLYTTLHKGRSRTRVEQLERRKGIGRRP